MLKYASKRNLKEKGFTLVQSFRKALYLARGSRGGDSLKQLVTFYLQTRDKGEMSTVLTSASSLHFIHPRSLQGDESATVMRNILTSINTIKINPYQTCPDAQLLGFVT